VLGLIAFTFPYLFLVEVYEDMQVILLHSDAQLEKGSVLNGIFRQIMQIFFDASPKCYKW
jgi:hypothetical protein